MAVGVSAPTSGNCKLDAKAATNSWIQSIIIECYMYKKNLSYPVAISSRTLKPPISVNVTNLEEWHIKRGLQLT